MTFSSFSIHAFFDHALDRIKWWGKRIMRLFCVFFLLKIRFIYKRYFKLYAFTITHLICVESCLLRYLFNVSLLILIYWLFLIKIGICIIKFILYRKLLEIYILSHFYTSKNLQYGRAVKWAFSPISRWTHQKYVIFKFKKNKNNLLVCCICFEIQSITHISSSNPL